MVELAYIRGGSRTAATSKMDLFMILVNGFQPLTIITKCSILYVAAVLDPPLYIFIVKNKSSSAELCSNCFVQLTCVTKDVCVFI